MTKPLGTVSFQRFSNYLFSSFDTQVQGNVEDHRNTAQDTVQDANTFQEHTSDQNEE